MRPYCQDCGRQLTGDDMVEVAGDFLPEGCDKCSRTELCGMCVDLHMDYCEENTGWNWEPSEPEQEGSEE